MRYLSDITGRSYNTVEELQKDEAEATRKDDNRKKRAKEVEKAFDEARASHKKADDLLKAFCADYGQYNTSIRSSDLVSSFFDDFFNWL